MSRTLPVLVNARPFGRYSMVDIDAKGAHVAPVGGHGSHLVGDLSEANALIVVPEEVTSVKPGEQVQVLVLDRWTDPKVDDAVLAQKGLEVRTYDAKKNPFKNVNTKVTFRIPVRDNTTFLLHHCISKDEPLQSKSVTAGELADAPAEDKLVLLTIDADGYTTGGETLAGC